MAEPARTYRSPRRALQAHETRVAVLAAARASFAEKGWAGTSIRDVAAAAGVSVETVYGSVGAKSALFAAAYDGAIAGDDDPTPIAERPAWRAMEAGATFEERAGAAADLIAGIMQRSHQLERTLREGAASHPAMAALLAEDESNRRFDTRRGLAIVLQRPVSDEESDLFCAYTSPEVYDALVVRWGWSPERYRVQIVQWFIGMGAP